MIETILFYLRQYADRYSLLLPLGVIGIWRWSVWSMKEIIGSNYRPKTQPYNASVSVVVPVYNEDPKVFATALESWEKNKPDEIIAVIDYTDRACIRTFREFAKTHPNALLIVTKRPGKRPALADGIKKAIGEVVALVDSDTIWGDEVIRYGLSPFDDPKVAGVATYQSVWESKTFAQKIFDAQLDLRYLHEYPFLAASGDALVCLSGRTAFYRRAVLLPMLGDLVNERFLGRPVISGDDKCLTYLVLKAGWKTAYQSNSHVYTPGMRDVRSYLKQRLRWTRNSIRADSKAMLNGWPLKHPALFFFQIDKILQSFVIILSPIFFFIAVVSKLWIVAAIILCWWFISRTVKMHPYLLKKPRNFYILPGFVLYSFLTGILRIYAFFTLNAQSWITRWDKSRLPKYRFLQTTFATVATASVVTLLSSGVYQYKQHTYFIPRERKEQLLQAALPRTTRQLAVNNTTVLGVSTAVKKNLLVRRYKAKEGDSLASIAQKFGVDVDQLYFANSAKLPSFGYVAEGTVLSVPGRDLVLDQATNSNYSTQSAALALRIYYDGPTNTVVVIGRGKRVTLKDLQNAVGRKYLLEVSPKVWLAKTSIFLYHGVTLELDKKEVTWLKLESGKRGFVMLRSLSADVLVNGVKITSWDSEKGEYDKDIRDGRSFIMVKDNARMDFRDSEAAYLGYATNPNLSVSPYGVSWKISNLKVKNTMLTGEVTGSKFHNNYFGAYTFGATGMTFRGNLYLWRNRNDLQR
ncbi:glycosyltransferase [Candidatus Roizmanbacteria bacterium]|nr:glycosyltransferase [Candidatus Roizmanbacteria bacterium]